jgi:succinate dehydrogenase / fumarate reductase cytochrome b subunit
LLIVCRGKRNLAGYPYVGNIRYTLQRATGVIAFLFILWHVFHMHGWLKNSWWMEHVVRPLGGGKFDPRSAYTAAEAIQASIWIQLLYALGMLACVYHLANGLWTMGITWGLWTSPRAQRWANIPCAAIGVFLAVTGLAAIVGMVEATKPSPAAMPKGHVERRIDGVQSFGSLEWTVGNALRGVPEPATEASLAAHGTPRRAFPTANPPRITQGHSGMRGSH